MDIKFYWNGNIAGTNYSFSVDDEMFELTRYGMRAVQNEDEAIDKIVELLKEKFDIDYKKEDIKFRWGGRL